MRAESFIPNLVFSLVTAFIAVALTISSWVLGVAGILRLLEVHSVLDGLLPSQSWWMVLLLAGLCEVLPNRLLNFAKKV